MDQRLDKYFAAFACEAQCSILDALKSAGEGELMRAASHMKRLLATAPDSLDILYNYAKLCYAIYSDTSREEELKRDFKEVSRRLFETCMEKHPGFSGSYYYLGYFYLNGGLYEKAALIWEKYLTLASAREETEVAEIKKQMAILSELVKFERGYLAVLSGKPDEGLALILPLLKKDGSAWNIMFFAGVAYRQKGDYEKAIGLFLKVLDKRPSQSETMNELGLCYAARNNFAKAEKYLKKALLIKEDDPEILCNLAGLYIQEDRIAEGALYLSRARQIAPDDEIAARWQQVLEERSHGRRQR